MEKEIRKHSSHLLMSEVEFINKTISNGYKKNINKHVEYRMNQLNISKSDIYEVFNNFSLIEYHFVPSPLGLNDSRVVIRDNSDKENQLCLSVSLISGEIITVFSNSKNDNHNTLNRSLYNRKIDVIADVEKTTKHNRKVLHYN